MQKKTVFWIVATFVVLVGVIIAGFWYFRSGQEESTQETEKETSDFSTTQPQSKTKFEKSVFFIHHSTGEIYWEGGMREVLENAGYDAAAPWWDGNTDPQDFYSEFTNADNWELLEGYDIIIFKSCFPASDIESDSELQDYKEWYNQLYLVYEDHQNKLFVPMSTPPLLEENTTAAAAKRSLDFENWLLTDYKNNYSGKNLAPFDLHSLLSDSEGFLAPDFIADSEDDHPNSYSGQIVGEAIVEHLAPYVN